MTRSSLSKRFLIVWVAMFGIGGRLLSCQLNPASSWFWSDDELIRRTDQIIVGRVIGATPVDPTTWNYEFEVLETVKGPASLDYRFTVKNAAAPSFQPHWPNNPGRAVHTKDCKILVGFETGKTYLIFRDAFHPKGYEAIADVRTDTWLRRVKSACAK